jgi:flagellar hook-associated protein 2
MAGTLSSLGLGSSGALSADTIDKLKTNDEQLQINPIKAKIENTTQKTQAYDLISSLTTGLSASTDRLGGDLLYLNRSTSVNGDGASVTAENGVAPQSFTVDVTKLATKDVNQSTAFTGLSAKVATGDDTVSISIDGQNFDIKVTDQTTLEEFKNSINDIAGEKVTANILNVADGDFRLIISSKETGSNQDITFSDNGFLTGSLIDQADTDADGIADGIVQTAGDSSFKYNGINFTRSSNTITDITVGVSITLLEEGKSATATVSQDTDEIVTELTTLTSAYNSLFKELTNTTTSDLDEGSVGIFNGENTIKTLSREINKLLFQVDTQGNSIVNYGFELNQDGTLTFDAAAFKTEFNKDPDAAEKLFKYETDSNGDVVDGIFKKLDDYLDNQTSSSGLLSTFGTSLSNQVDALFEEQTRAQTLLDARYETMFFRFAAFDRIIGGLEQQFSSLQQQIEMAINAK